MTVIQSPKCHNISDTNADIDAYFDTDADMGMRHEAWSLCSLSHLPPCSLRRSPSVMHLLRPFSSCDIIIPHSSVWSPERTHWQFLGAAGNWYPARFFHRKRHSLTVGAIQPAVHYFLFYLLAHLRSGSRGTRVCDTATNTLKILAGVFQTAAKIQFIFG